MGYKSGVYFNFRLSTFRWKEQELARCYSPRVGGSLESCQLCISNADMLLKGAAKLSGPDEKVNAD